MTHRWRRASQLLFLCPGLVSAVHATTEFDTAVVSRYGAEQLRYLGAFLAAKPPTAGQPARSLVASSLVESDVRKRPPIDFSALAGNSESSGDTWLSLAEALYASEQYALASQALGQVGEGYRIAHAARVDSLQLKLALRRVGAPPAAKSAPRADPVFALNLGLASRDRKEAVARLRALADDSDVPLRVRHRAMLWAAVLLHEGGERGEALETLADIEADTPLLAEVLFAYLRARESVHPVTAGAIEKQIGALVPDSPAAWEARDYLIRALHEKGAAAQMTEIVLDTIASVDRVLARFDRQLAALDRLPPTDLSSLLDSLPDGRRQRADELIQRRGRLLQQIGILKAWRPHVDSYAERLQRNPSQFSDEIRFALLDARQEALRNDKGNTARQALFDLELSKLLGTPRDPLTAYRIFIGLAQWEFDFEYPETWHPATEDADEESRHSRRRRREERARQAEDRQLLPEAIAHAGKLLGKVEARLADAPRYVLHGMADSAKAIALRNAEQVGAIERLLPALEQGARLEIAEGLKERRRIAQQWLNRFAFYALAAYTRQTTSGEQLHFELEPRISLKKGESLFEILDAIGGEGRKRKATEIPVTAAWQALKPVTAGGETREIRAAALLLRAQLAVLLYETQAIASADDAVDHYRELLQTYPDLIDGADVVYQLARAQDLAQRMEPSLATLTNFVKAYPADPRRDEALFRIGEMQFSLSEYQAARTAYESVLRTGDPRYREHAEYKLAWTLLKLGDADAALPRFIAVIDRATGDASQGKGRNGPDRLKDAFRAVSLTFSYLNGAADVERFFARFGARPYVSDIYYNLAGYYLEHNRINDAANAYAYLTRHHPNDPRAPLLLAAVVKQARQEKLAKLSLDLQEKFVDAYAVSAPYWQQAPAEVRARVDAEMQPFLAELAQMYHADAQQQGGATSYAKAIRYYRQFVDTFPKGEQTPHFHFLLAEARFETGDFANAVADYEAAAYRYGAHAEAVEAGYAVLVASQKLADAEVDPEARKSKLRALVARSSRFADTFAGDVRVDAVLVKAAEDILMLGGAGEAVKLAENLLARKPAESVRRRAAIAVAHAYFESGAFAKAEAAYQEALALKGHAPALQQELLGRLGLSVYRQAEAYRAAGDAAKATETFLRVATIAPGTEPVPNAEIDASALLLAAKRWGDATEVLERFMRNYPHHPLAAGIPLKLAFVYENDGRFLKAADMLEALSQSERDEPLARQMLLRSAELRQKGERVELAVGTYERYLNRYPQPLEKATEVRQTLADIAARAKDLATRDRWLSELINQAKAAGEASVRVRALAGAASLTFGDARAAEFDAIKLKLPLDRSLAAKRSSMEQALKWYDEAGAFAIAEVTTAATFRTAEIYRRLAADLLASERPGGLNALETEQYGILLEEEATPFEESATEFHEINYRRIPSGIYDEWVKRSMVSLRSLMPARYDRVELPESHFEYTPPKPVEQTDGKAKPDVEGELKEQGKGNAQAGT